MEELIKIAFEGGGIATFVYFVIKGMRKEIKALSDTIQHQNETFDAMSKRITETERMAESYKKWWEELQESYDKHKAALTKAKDEYITELQKAIDMKDEQLVSKARTELDVISMKERTIEELKKYALEKEEQLLAMMERAKNLSEIDPLTGLRSRVAIEMGINKRIRQNIDFCVLLIDLDRFKQFNDNYGHRAGDRLLIEQSRKIVALGGKEAAIGRVGGNEFAIVSELEMFSDIELFANKLLHEIARPSVVDDLETKITASIGIALYPKHAAGARSLLTKAEMALYNAKSKGGNCFKIWEGGSRLEDRKHA